MKFKAEFKRIDFRLADYLKAMRERLVKINNEAGQAWLHEAVDKTPIPTWSGASRATFQKLASELGTTVPLGPLRTRSRVALGRAEGAGSGVFEDVKRGQIGFIYTTGLRYLAYNEYNQAVPGPPPQPFSRNVRFTPYGFQNRAVQVWLKKAEKAKLPSPTRFFKVRKLK